MSVDGWITSLKLNVTIAGGTIAAGVSTALEYIPEDIGKLTSLVGLILSITLILVQWTNYRRGQLELEIMRRKEAERLDKKKARDYSGIESKRVDD